MALLEPQYSQQRQQLQTQLANQGLSMDSEAYKNAMGNMDRQQDWSRTQAANNATLTGQNYENQLFGQGLNNAQLGNSARAQQLQQLLTLHDQPLNEYNSMLSGTQIQTPQFQGSPSVMANAPSYQNAANTAYQGQLNAYNSQVGSQNSFLSGLMGLGGMYLLGSDAEIKQDIVKVGDHPAGFGVYEFDYKPEYANTWGRGRRRGVLAQEVQAVMPEAVQMHPDGYLMVDYGRIGGLNG
jgi:hypothetical protein